MNTKKNLHDALVSLANRDFDTAAKLLAPVLQAKSAKIVEGKKENEHDEEDEHEQEHDESEKSKSKKYDKECD